jgi:hypothetical protein
MSEYDNAAFRWLGKPNTFPKGTGTWKRTEIARKMSGKTVSELSAATQPSTPWTLVRMRLIEIEGYQGRATSSEMTERYDELYAIVEASQPMNVRSVFYQAVARGMVPKEEDKGYDPVQRALVVMRRNGMLPFEWIVDFTRREIRPYTNTSIAQALQDAADQYRRRLWTDEDPCVQIWIEKEGLTSVIQPITDKYDVALCPARGMSGIAFLHVQAEKLPADCPCFIYHLGDLDKWGLVAGEKIEEDLGNFAPDADIHFERLAITPEQITLWDLPTRPPKASDDRVKEAVELDAVDPRHLRRLVEKAILKHLPKKKYDALMKQEQRERERIQELVDEMEGQIDEEPDEE